MKSIIPALLLLIFATASSAQTADAPAFDVLEIRVLGNSTLPPESIEAAVYPHTGPGKSLAEVQAARDDLERAYRDAGYGTVFVDVPEQDVTEGIVRLKVTEGRLDRIRVTGARYFSNGRILAELPSLQRGAVPSLATLQQELVAVNQAGADRAITPVLKAGRTPGTVDIELKVRDELPVHGGLTVNDRYTANTTRTRVNVDLSYTNLFQKFHSLSLQYQTAPQNQDEAKVIAATYVAPLPNRDLLAVYGVDTDSDIAAIGTLSVLGKGRIYGLRYIHPWTSLGGAYDSVSLGADLKDFSETINLTSGVSDRTPIRYINWSAAYSHTLRRERRLDSINISLNAGLRRIVNNTDQFAFKRFDGRPNYVYLRASGIFERPAPFGTTLALKLTAQYSPQPLISNEQLGIGGAATVRGYLDSELLGDYGFASSLEWHAPTVNWQQGEQQTAFDAFLFYDAGLVGLHEPLSQSRRSDLASVGLGLRWSGWRGLRGSLEWANPLVPSANVLDGEQRLHFEIQYQF
jgi:hemolysin activation/secretion protein